MYELRRDGGPPLWRPRVDAWALAATSAPSLFGLTLGYSRKSERGPSSTGAGASPLSDARCRPLGRARLAVATASGRRRSASTAWASLRVHSRHAIARRRDCVYVVSSLGRSYLEIRFAVRCVFDAVGGRL